CTTKAKAACAISGPELILAPMGGGPPIRVKLAPHRVADVRSSLSPGMSEPAVHVWIGVQQCIKCEWPDYRADKPSQGDVLHAPKRRDIGLIKQVLRGKIPGIPGIFPLRTCLMRPISLRFGACRTSPWDGLSAR